MAGALVSQFPGRILGSCAAGPEAAKHTHVLRRGVIRVNFVLLDNDRAQQ